MAKSILLKHENCKYTVDFERCVVLTKFREVGALYRFEFAECAYKLEKMGLDQKSRSNVNRRKLKKREPAEYN